MRKYPPLDRQTPAAEQAQAGRAFAAPVWISLGMLRTPESRMAEWEDMFRTAM